MADRDEFEDELIGMAIAICITAVVCYLEPGCNVWIIVLITVTTFFLAVTCIRRFARPAPPPVAAATPPKPTTLPPPLTTLQSCDHGIDDSTTQPCHDRNDLIMSAIAALEILKKYDFPASDYDILGQILGISSHTLKDIASKNNADPIRCLLECLKEWIKMASAEKSLTKPATWNSLIRALRNPIFDLNAIAVKIDNEKHPACVIFAHHSSTLFQCIQNPVPIARLLHGEKIIDDRKLSKILSTNCNHNSKKKKLLKAVQKAICVSQCVLEKFATILLADSATVQDEANAILKEWKPQFYGEGTSTTIEKIPVPSEVLSVKSTEAIHALRAKFASTFSRITTEVVNKDPCIDSLKDYLAIGYETQLSGCHSVKDVMKLITNKCSLIDTVMMEGVLDHLEDYERLDMTDARQCLSQYKEIIDKVCQEVSVDMCLNEKFSNASILKSTTATFYVDRKAEEWFLGDVKDVLKLAFEKLAKLVSIVVIRESKSFTIFCSFPLALSESLIVTAIENLELLKEKGLLRLTIGYSTVYSTTHDEIQRSQEAHFSAVFGSRGTQKQLLLALNVQVLNKESQLLAQKQKGTDLKEKVELLTSHLEKLKKATVEEPLQDSESEDLDSYVVIGDKDAEEEGTPAVVLATEELLEKKREELAQREKELKEREESIAEQFKSIEAVDMHKRMAKATHSQLEQLKTANKRLQDEIASSRELLEGSKKPSPKPLSTTVKKPQGTLYWYSNSVTLNSLSSEQYQEFTEKLKDNHCSIEISSCSSVITAKLLTFLAKNKNVIKLSVTSTDLTEECVHSLAHLITVNKCIQHIMLKSCSLTDNAVDRISQSLNLNTTLTYLDLRSSSGLKHESISRLIRDNSTLVHLYLYNVSFTSDGIDVLFDALNANQVLKHLGLDQRYVEICFASPKFESIKHRLDFY